MSTELWLLLWSLVVYALYLGAQSLIFRWHYGVKFAATARDHPPPEGELLGRAERALKNFNETYVPFVAMLLIAHLADRGDAVVFWGAVLWFAGRLAYLPLYLFGVVLVRSLVWCVIGAGLFVMFCGLVF
ncbi:MAG TPA: MAPEG family protein [Devosia sp.]|jgi:uncharacterized MAPEG superfamily protein|nr:MAPEG family protein [Devosia sp.]